MDYACLHHLNFGPTVALSRMIENISFMGDLVLYLPDASKSLLRDNEWSTFFKCILSLCRESAFLNSGMKTISTWPLFKQWYEKNTPHDNIRHSLFSMQLAIWSFLCFPSVTTYSTFSSRISLPIKSHYHRPTGWPLLVQRRCENTHTHTHFSSILDRPLLPPFFINVVT